MRPVATARQLAAALTMQRVAALALLLAAPVAMAQQARPACSPDPLDGRALYLRGTVNGWGTPDAQRFTWACTRYELVTRLDGHHTVKLGDEAWSADADLGVAAPATPGPAGPFTESPTRMRLVPRGPGLSRDFKGIYRFVMTPASTKATDAATITAANTATSQPELSISACPAAAPPLGDTKLFLRGSMNNWTALEDDAFQWSCDAYYLNVKLNGTHSFRIADAAGAPATSFAAAQGGRREPSLDQALDLARGNGAHALSDLSFAFGGEFTLKLAFVDAGQAQLTIGPRSFADPRAAAVTNPLALSLRHDSRSDRTPYGAVPAGTTVSFRVAAAPGVEQLTLVVERRRLEGNQEVLEYQPVARIPMRREALQAQAPAAAGAAPTGQATGQPQAPVAWVASQRFDQLAVYGYWFEAQIAGQTFIYQNNTDALHWTREKGSGGLGSVAERPTRPDAIRRYRLSVYDPAFQTPAWARDTVWYYIFPERYRNGDRGNDPKPGVRRYQDKGIELHPRWNEPPYKPGSGDGSDAHYNNDFFGGDLAGIIDKLGDIADLGANAIYMTPVFAAASNHKYDTADYHQIDPAFGSNADFERLTREAAKHGIRVVVDASLNHTGADSIYFDRWGNHGRAKSGQPGGQLGAFANGRIRPESPYASWYSFDASQTDPERQFKGWVGVSDLPELDKHSPAWRDFAYRAPGSVTRTWLNRGAAGWRMDVAPWVPDDFWREWRSVVKASKPDAITIAETWFDAAKHLLGDMFDATMNYIFRNAVLDYANGGTATALATQLEALRESYPPPAFAALMNLLSSHDQARSLHVFGHHGAASTPAEIALAKQRLRLAVAFQMSYPGAPTVYYGDEVGVTGGDDPYNRATYPWPDEGGQPDLALRAEFKRLIALRHAHPVLRHGSLGAPAHVDDHVLVLPRRLGETWAYTATNNADQARRVSLPLPAGAPRRWNEAGTGRVLVAAADGRLAIDVPAMAGIVLLGQ